MQKTYTVPFDETVTNSIGFDYLGKQLSRVLAPEFINAANFLNIDNESNPAWTEASVGVPQRFCTFTLRTVAMPSAAQVVEIDRLCSNPALWVDRTRAGSFTIDTRTPELITQALEQAVPGKGLLYYGSHGRVGFDWEKPLTNTQKKLAREVFLSIGVTTP